MFYQDTKGYKYRENIGKWMKDYSMNIHNKDWDYCLGLTYRYPEVTTRNIRNNMRGLYNKLKKYDQHVDGFVVTEYEKGMKSLHHHLIVSSSIEDGEFKKVVESFWNPKGISWIQRYDRGKNYVEYMSKHIGKTEQNKFDFLTNFEW